jgi:O-antigen/teichoic acid export membrane protein
LRERAFRAGVWTLGAHGFDLAVRLITNLIMTRLLFPDAFGIIAAATAPIVGLGLVSDFGIRAVIAQSALGDQDDFLRSAWVLQLWRGIILWTILAAMCGLLSFPFVHSLLPPHSVYADRSFPLITAVLGLSLILSGAESTAIPLNLRHLNLKPIALLDMAGRILPLPVMVIWAWTLPSVWALVVGGLAGGTARLILSHVAVPGPRMAMKWSRDHFQEIGHFGKWIAVSSFASFVGQQSDVILFGFLLPTSMLGLYFIAKLLAEAGQGLLERLISSLALPVLGEVIRQDRRNLRDRYYKFRLPIDLVAAALGGILLTTGNLIVQLLYDPRYSQAGSMLQVLSIGIAIYPLYQIRTAFTATGETHIPAGISILQAVSLIAAIVTGFVVFGTWGAIVGIATHRLVPSIVILVIAHRRSWINVWQELRIIPIFVIGIIIGELVLAIARAFGLTETGLFWR